MASLNTVNHHIDEIVRILETKVDFNVSEIIKGGSLGHGTAVPGKFDLDLVLYSRDISPRDVIENGVGEYLRKLNGVLMSSYGHNYCLDNQTPFALQFTLYGDLEVDLLPSPYWSSADEYIGYLGRLRHPQRRNFQCSEAKWEKEFFQRQPNEVKEYIKRAKAWRNREWFSSESGTGRPKSFLLGLLIIEGYRQAAWPKDPVAITKEVKRMVKNHQRLSIHWVGDGAMYDRSYLRVLEQPFILDPANPFNNVYKSGVHSYRPGKLREDRYNEGDGNWTIMVRNIDRLDLTQSV